MAREIRGIGSSGNTLYARILNAAGLWWNGSTFEAYAAANWANYRVAMAEQGSSGVYVADFPAGIDVGGTYDYFVHAQGGGSPAEGDSVIENGHVDWTGTAAVTAAAGAMSGSDFRDYIVDDKGFVRDDKDQQVYSAITDAIQIMRRRFGFSEAETEAESTDQITVLGDFKLAIESDFGLLQSVILEDGSNGIPLFKINKARFDELYADINVTTAKGVPKHYCVFADQIYLGPIPEQVTYNYRLSYSKRAGTVTSSTTGVPFTNLYRDVLADKALELLYRGLGEHDEADRYRGLFEAGFLEAQRRERVNRGDTVFVQDTIDF